VAPYVWFSNIDGTNEFGDFAVAVEDSVLETGIDVRVEAGKARWRGVATFSWAKVANVGEISGPGVAPGTRGAFDLAMWTLELLASVQVGTFRTSDAAEMHAGVRYVRQRQRTELGVGPDPTITERETWIEPVVGSRYFAELGDRLWTTVGGDISGFGVGSKFTWKLEGELAFRVVAPLDLAIRYRYQEAKYDNDGTEYLWEGVNQGWLFGAILKL
jgi:hypothetical protein